MMNFIKIMLVLSGLVVFSTSVLAHSQINTTKPVNEAILAEAPATIDFKFAKTIRLTKVVLQLSDRDPVDLDLSAYKGFEKLFSLPNPFKDVGFHKIEWRGLGTDGHVVQDSFTFTVE